MKKKQLYHWESVSFSKQLATTLVFVCICCWWPRPQTEGERSQAQTKQGCTSEGWPRPGGQRYHTTVRQREQWSHIDPEGARDLKGSILIQFIFLIKLCIYMHLIQNHSTDTKANEIVAGSWINNFSPLHYLLFSPRSVLLLLPSTTLSCFSFWICIDLHLPQIIKNLFFWHAHKHIHTRNGFQPACSCQLNVDSCQRSSTGKHSALAECWNVLCQFVSNTIFSLGSTFD